MSVQNRSLFNVIGSDPNFHRKCILEALDPTSCYRAARTCRLWRDAEQRMPAKRIIDAGKIDLNDGGSLAPASEHFLGFYYMEGGYRRYFWDGPIFISGIPRDGSMIIRLAQSAIKSLPQSPYSGPKLKRE
jgi:hypothetical protein